MESLEEFKDELGVATVNKDLHKIAKRLSYLWHLSDTNPRLYSRLGLGVEKENIYVFYPEAVPLAREYFKKLGGR